MTTYNPIQGFVATGALLLGNFAAMWGFLVAPIYLVGFGLMVPDAVRGVAGPVSGLPIEVPMIGVLLGVAALAISRSVSRANLLPIALGIGLNGVATLLAVALWVLQTTS